MTHTRSLLRNVWLLIIIPGRRLRWAEVISICCVTSGVGGGALRMAP